ncbi:MAG: EamA family transporter [Chitinophagaceae bacterium]|nr:MAG: EamA family transporter [Chitinophagaceae bacterium]
MTTNKQPSVMMIVMAFLAVYIIWGSTYFFIEIVVHELAPTVFGAIRFLIAGLFMLAIAIFKKENLWDKTVIKHSLLSGVLLLLVGNGAVMMAEKSLPSSFVAIFGASSPLWFLLLDYKKWKLNFSNSFTLAGVFFGLLGVLCLFYEKLFSQSGSVTVLPLFLTLLSGIGWVIGSLYSQYKISSASTLVVSTWQMIGGSLDFLMIGLMKKDFANTEWSQVSQTAWWSIVYLIIFGSIIGYSAYVFLLKYCTATQVSTYAYVNPVVAVLLGVLINHDHLTALQLAGLLIILCGVFFINVAKKLIAKSKERKASLQN